MSTLDDILGTGSGPDPSQGMDQYLAYLMAQEQKQAQDTARGIQQAQTITDQRRDELLNRPGYSGDVNVGPAQQRTSATLDAQMKALDPSDPTRVAYEQAITKKAGDTTTSYNIISGRQYEAQDAYAALLGQIGSAQANSRGGVDIINNLIAQANQLKSQYASYDNSNEMAQLNAALAAAQTARDRAINTPGHSGH